MTGNVKNPKVVSDSDRFVYTVKKLGSETKPIEYKSLFITFIIGSVFMLAGILAFIAFGIPFLDELRTKHLTCGVFALVAGIILMIVTFKLEKSEGYTNLEKENINKRKLLIKYIALVFFKDNELVDISSLKKDDSNSLKDKIAPIDNCLSFSIADIDYIIGQLTSELKVLEAKKNVTISVSVLIAAFKTILAFVENASKTYWYYQVNSLDDLGVEAKKETFMSFIDSGADTLASFCVCFLVFMGFWILKNGTTTISAGFGVQCRNVEYTIDVLNEFKDIIQEQTREDVEKNNEVVESLKIYQQSLFRSIEQQNEILKTVASTMIETKEIVSEEKLHRKAISDQNELLLQLMNSELPLKEVRKNVRDIKKPEEK